MVCAVCEGTGKLLADVCPLCDGDVDSMRSPRRTITQPMPFTRTKSRKTIVQVDAGVVVDCKELRLALKMLHQHSTKIDSEKPPSVKPSKAKVNKRGSQLCFAEQNQTVIVYDWDDTLFPTNWMSEDLDLDWTMPLEKQEEVMSDKHAGGTYQDIKNHFARCEDCTLAVLAESLRLGHVVIVTLANDSWVAPVCTNFYPRVGQFIKDNNIRVIYAQDNLTKKQKTKLASLEEWSDIERFYGILKGRAIADDCEKFYSQYEGQSWKNILSVGDASFERYGLLAATTSYWRHHQLGCDKDVWGPADEGHWEKTEGDRTLKLRAKCCKMVDSPNINEMIQQLELATKWLPAMVSVDAGFDLDFETLDDAKKVETAEAVLRGEQPPTALPAPSSSGGGTHADD